tara:strand:+ start:1627 stop:2700 length:1074 start_codon:yes stop_codon:yes gene_type:complete
MAQKFGPDKRKGNLGRTKIDPRRGGKAGDAGPKFQREGAQPRTKITDSRISDSPDAGFSGSKKSIAPGSFKAAFAVAFAKGPGTLFTFKGKKYKAIKKHEGKGPSASRVEDKVSKATIIKGKRDTTKSKTKAQTNYALAGASASAGAGAVAKKKSKAKTPASGRFGQRKAGGIMKASDGKAVVKKAFVGKFIAKRIALQAGKGATELTKLTKAQRETLMKMPDKQREATIKRIKASFERADKAPKLNKKKVAAIFAVPAAVVLNKKKGKADTAKPKRKEDKVSQANIIGQGSKKGRRAGGIMKANSGKMANKDYDGDGRIESSTAEYMGSRDKAIKQSKKLRGGGAAIRGNNFKGIF